jgi:hypothetical protein
VDVKLGVTYRMVCPGSLGCRLDRGRGKVSSYTFTIPPRTLDKGEINGISVLQGIYTVKATLFFCVSYVYIYICSNIEPTLQM